jgi:exodeoxyribonuclease-5
LDAIARWRETRDQPVFRLFGAAGTGKTHTIKELIENNVLFATYTGKAAHVLRSKGVPAVTIHSLIYLPKERSRFRLNQLEGQLADLLAELGPNQPGRQMHDLEARIAEEKKQLSRPAFSLNPDSELRKANLLVVDEVSMVDTRMADDLLSFQVPILAVGDPYQLPPVAGTGFFIKATPDVLLTEVHRQAAENPIIRLATEIRNGKRPKPDGNMVVPWGSTTPDAALGYEQIIVGRNKTRKQTNFRIRSLKKIEDPLPINGDRVICLRNNHDAGLLNGSIWQVVERAGDDDIIDLVVKDNGEEITIPVWRHHFTDPVYEPLQLSFWERQEAEEFDYGYAITAHKSQGSEWSSVLVLDESSVFRADAMRWLYTAVTRAKDKLTLVVRN